MCKTKLPNNIKTFEKLYKCKIDVDTTADVQEVDSWFKLCNYKPLSNITNIMKYLDGKTTNIDIEVPLGVSITYGIHTNHRIIQNTTWFNLLNIEGFNQNIIGHLNFEDVKEMFYITLPLVLNRNLSRTFINKTYINVELLT